MTRSHQFQNEAEEIKKLRKMSGEEGITVTNLKEEINEEDKTSKKGF